MQLTIAGRSRFVAKCEPVAPIQWTVAGQCRLVGQANKQSTYLDVHGMPKVHDSYTYTIVNTTRNLWTQL